MLPRPRAWPTRTVVASEEMLMGIANGYFLDLTSAKSVAHLRL
jgi:hypothetical protein